MALGSGARLGVLIIKDAVADGRAQPTNLVVVERWFDELRQRVPTR